MLLGPGDCLQGGGLRDSGRRTTPPTALGTSGSRRGGRASWRCEAAAAGSADRFPSECTCQGVSLSMLRSVLVNVEARRHRVQRRCAASFIILFVCLFLICFPKTGPFRFKWQITLPPTSLHAIICQLTSGFSFPELQQVRRRGRKMHLDVSFISDKKTKPKIGMIVFRFLFQILCYLDLALWVFLNLLNWVVRWV